MKTDLTLGRAGGILEDVLILYLIIKGQMKKNIDTHMTFLDLRRAFGNVELNGHIKL